MSGARRAFRYSVISGGCLVLATTLIPLFSYWGIHYALATCLAFCIVSVVGFVLHSHWTFEVEGTLKSFARYTSAMALNLPIAVAIIGAAHDLGGLSVAISAVLSSMTLFAWNYLGARWAIRHESEGTLR